MSSKKNAITFILFTVVLDAMGIGIIMPVMPELLQELRQSDISNAALWGGALSAVFALMQFLCGPAIGNLSDWFGRRKVLLASLLVVGFDYILMAITGSIWVLMLGRIIGGIASATQSTANAYMADISEPHEKAQNFGLVGAAFGIGFILGPMLGGALAEFGPRAPFWAAAALSFLNFLFGYFVLKESLAPENRRRLTRKRMNPFGALKFMDSLDGMRGLLLVFFFHQLAFFVYPAVWAYYTIGRYDWSPFMVGLSLMGFGLGLFIVQGLLIRVVIPKLGEENTVRMGLILSIISFAAVALSPYGWLTLALIPISALAMIAQPALSGITSKSVPNDAQGELQGVLTAVGAIASILSPLLMTWVFFAFTHEQAFVRVPGAPFFLAAVFELVGLAVFWVYWRQRMIATKRSS